MKLQVKTVPIDALHAELKERLKEPQYRVGHLTSIDGAQLVILILNTADGTGELWQSQLEKNNYTSLTLTHANLHWMERAMWDMFGIVPQHHPRLKPILLQEFYEPGAYPLRTAPLQPGDVENLDREFHFLDVKGDGVWQLPVGPIHAGVIEPGHFRFSCMGEFIQNLELKFGYVHRGVEKRLTEVPWKRARFVAECIAGDTSVANSLAHAIALEDMCGVEAPPLALALRTVALELERCAMHTIDVGGAAGDVGMVGINQSLSRLRGVSLGMGDALSGGRFMRAFILPGGVKAESRVPAQKMVETVRKLRLDLKPVTSMLLENQSAIDRMDGIGRLKPALAAEFGMVGVTARACGVDYDARRHFKHGLYPDFDCPVALEPNGDILARTKIRVKEIFNSLDIVEKVLTNLPSGPTSVSVPESLPRNAVAAAVVEAFRGELIHLIVTDDAGKIKRYAVKDPSWNNWTTISIAIRNGLIADFPLCNKSLALSYSGNDL